MGMVLRESRGRASLLRHETPTLGNVMSASPALLKAVITTMRMVMRLAQNMGFEKTYQETEDALMELLEEQEMM